MLSKLGTTLNRFLQVPLANYGITPQFMHPLDAELLLEESPKATKRTKTVCTIGFLSLHLDPKHNTPKMPACSLTKDSTWQGSTFPMEIMLSTFARWWVSDRP